MRNLAAKSIKAELRMRWPDVAFHVRYHGFPTGGGAVDITWPRGTGPEREVVYNIVERYEEGDFDGYSDSYVRKTDPAGILFREINGGAKYIHCQERAA